VNASSSFRRATTKRQLRHVFRTYVFQSTAVGRDGLRPAALEESWGLNAAILQRKLRDGSYEFTSYKEKLISKGARSYPRVASVATARDRVALKTLAEVLGSVFPEARTPPAQVRVGELALELTTTHHDAYVRADIRNFYPSVEHAALFALVRKRIRKPQLLRLLRRAVSTPTVAINAKKPGYSSLRGVPQGLSVSNLLAEIAMADVDSILARQSHAAYFRYVDDIIILCDAENCSTIFTAIEDACKYVGLGVHPLEDGSKSALGLISEGFDYLGYVFHTEGISVRESSVRRLERTLVSLFSEYKRDQSALISLERKKRLTKTFGTRLNLVISGCIYEGVPRGWLHYFSQMTDMTLLGRLDAFVRKLWARFELPADQRPKSFARTYRHVTTPNRQTRAYIPNFDRYSDLDKRETLLALLPDMTQKHLDNLTTAELDSRFRSEVKHIAKLLDRDTSRFS